MRRPGPVGSRKARRVSGQRPQADDGQVEAYADRIDGQKPPLGVDRLEHGRGEKCDGFALLDLEHERGRKTTPDLGAQNHGMVLDGRDPGCGVVKEIRGVGNLGRLQNLLVSQELGALDPNRGDVEDRHTGERLGRHGDAGPQREDG